MLVSFQLHDLLQHQAELYHQPAFRRSINIMVPVTSHSPFHMANFKPVSNRFNTDVSVSTSTCIYHWRVHMATGRWGRSCLFIN